MKIKVNDKTYTSDGNGVITLYYDYQTDLTVDDGKTYTAGDLRRKIMTYDHYWYYIGSGEISYGSASDDCASAEDSKDKMKTIGVVLGVSDAVHLWQGCALDKKGTVYKITGGNTEAVSKTWTNLEQLENAKPFWNDTVNNIQVYYGFSLYKENTKIVPYRVFTMGDQTYTVSVTQNTVPDSVILSTKTSYGVPKRYFALLDQSEHTLTSYLTSMNLGSLTNSGILYTSNNLGYDGTLLVAAYRNGFIGVDYSTGGVVFDTRPKIESFLGYAKHVIAGTGLLGNPDIISDGSFFDGENLREDLLAGGEYAPSGPASATGDSNTASAVDGGISSGESGESGVPAGVSGTDAAAGGADMNGSAVISGSGEAVSGGEAVNGDAAVNGPGSSGGQMSGVEADGTATDEPGAETGAEQASGSDAANGSGEGSGSTAASGKADSGMAGMAGMAGTAGTTGKAESNGGSSGEDDVERTTEAALKELFGSSLVAYSDKTGRYELLDTGSLAEGRQVEAADVLADKRGGASGAADNTDSKEELDDSGENDHRLSIAWGINRSLDTSEKQGFVLIALAAAAGVLVLVALFCKVRKRK